MNQELPSETRKTPEIPPPEGAPRPWEGEEKEGEESLLEKYGQAAEPSNKTKNYIEQSLKKETSDRMINFANKWFKSHVEELKKQGIFTDVSEERKAAIAIEKGALRELREKDEYKKDYEGIENLMVLRTGLREGGGRPENQFLLLNYLEAQKINKEKELEELKKKGAAESEIKAKEKELEELFGARKELFEKTTGRGLQEESEKEAKEKNPQQQYIDKGLEERKKAKKAARKREICEKEWNKLPKEEKIKYNDSTDFQISFLEEGRDRMEKRLEKAGITLDEKEARDIFYELLKAGYSPSEIKVKGLFRKRIYLKKEGLKPQKMTLSEFDTLKEKLVSESERQIEKESKEELLKEWQKEIEKATRENMEKRITEAATAPEKASEGVRGVYQRMKEKLILEFTQQDLERSEKTKGQLEAIKKEFGGKGVDPTEIIRAALFRKGPVEKCSGDLKKDVPQLADFLNGCGIDVKDKEIRKLNLNAEEYTNAFKKERGFLLWLLDCIEKIRGKKKTQK